MQVLDLVLANGSKRHYLHLLTVSTVVDYYLQEAEDDLPAVLERVAKVMPVRLAEANLDSLYLILTLLDKTPSLSEEFCKETFGVKHLTKKSGLDLVAKVLLGSSLPLAAVEKHPVIRSLVRVLANQGLIGKFWSRLVSEMSATMHKGLVALLFLR